MCWIRRIVVNFYEYFPKWNEGQRCVRGTGFMHDLFVYILTLHNRNDHKFLCISLEMITAKVCLICFDFLFVIFDIIRKM